tara:strand:+ start:3889 stop:4614 length:726 start_codon:yes stop_codon:yes gene_type:complete
MNHKNQSEVLLWGFYDRMRPKEIEAILQQRPIAYLPWGAIEYHGSHNPTGLDSIKASHMCMDLAKIIGGLVLPVINLAANLISSYSGVNFPKHSLEFSEKLVRMLCEEYFEQLVIQDFKIIVLLSGHAGEPHLEILRTVAKEFNLKYGDRYFWVFAEFDVVPDDLLVANHSALGETSLQLYYAPKTVALDTLPNDRAISLEIDAISGEDPRSSTKELGEKIVKTFLNNASQRIEELIQIYI